MGKCLLTILTLSIFLFACGKWDEPGGGGGTETPVITLNVSSTPIEFPAEGGTQDVTVSTNATSWNVVSNQAWCSVTKETGKFIVSALANELAVSPSPATVTVTASGTTKSISITVTQAAAIISGDPSIEASIDTAYFREDGGYATIGVVTNQDEWSVSSDESWCVVTKLDEAISIDITEFWAGSNPRSANVTLTAGDSTFTLVVIQDPTASLSVTSVQGNSNISFSHNGGTIIINVYTNVSRWKVWADQDWVNVEVINDMSFSITVDASASGSSRPAAEVTIQANGRTHRLYISQDDPVSSGDDYQYDNPTGWD